MHHRFLTCFALLAGAAVLPATGARAQSAAAAQAQYQQALAACDPNQPRPVYNACVRTAGLVLDRSGTTGSGGNIQESSDGRATILQPSGVPQQNIDPSTVVPETTTSQDGRATLLVPSDSTVRSGGAVP